MCRPNDIKNLLNSFKNDIILYVYITKGEHIMSQIRVSPETLQSRAREYGKASNDIAAILSNLQRLQDTLSSEWEGAAFQGFNNQFLELKPKVQKFAELMQQINTQLDKTAQAMQQNDQELSRNFGLN